MKILNEVKPEITYVLELTESEIGTLKIALGVCSYGSILESVKENHSKVKILDSDSQQRLYVQLVNLVGDEYW